MLFNQKTNSISSMILELESGELSSSKKNAVCNELALSTIRLSKEKAQIQHLFTKETAQLEKRGNNPQEYLWNENVSLNDIFKSFYQHFPRVENPETGETVRQYDDALTISELLLMLGSFSWFQQLRIHILKTYEKQRKHLERKTNKKYRYYLNQPDGLAKLDGMMLLKSGLEDSIKEEQQFSSYISTLSMTVLKEVIHYLGEELENLTLPQVKSICTLALDSSYQYAGIRRELFIRWRNQSTVSVDVLYLEGCGDTSDALQDVLVKPSCISEKKKMITPMPKMD